MYSQMVFLDANVISNVVSNGMTFCSMKCPFPNAIIKTGHIEIFMFGNLTKNELRTSLESLFIEFSVNVIVSVKCSC